MVDSASAAESPRSRQRLRILFVTPYVPSPLRPRPFNLVKGLAARGHRLTLVAAATTAVELDHAEPLAPYCERIRAVRVPFARSLWSCVRGLAGGPPLQARYCVSPEMTAVLRTALAPPPAFDVLHVEHLRAALYGVAAPGMPRVYDAVDCMSRLLAQTASAGPTRASRWTARAEKPRTQRFERSLLRHFDRILLTADSERDAWLGNTDVADDAGDRIDVLANGVDLDHYAPADVPRDRATLLFLGRMGYHANFAAARRLVSEILPRIWSQRPEARLVIVGADPPPALRALADQAGSRVEVTGYVSDVRPYLARATVSVNPLSYAVGIQNKVLEAMAMATPVVATPTACAGLRAVSERNLLVGGDADGIAAAVVRLLDDASLAKAIGAAGRRYVEAHHDWRTVVANLETIYEDAIATFAPRSRPHTRGEVG